MSRKRLDTIHTHLVKTEQAHEKIAAGLAGFPSMTALRAQFAFGRPQTTNLVMTRSDFSKDTQTEAEFLAKLARLPPTLTQMTLDRTVLDITPEDIDTWSTMKSGFELPDLLFDADNRDPGHLHALCRSWPASLTSIIFRPNMGMREHLTLPLRHWRLPPGLTELRIPVRTQDFIDMEREPVLYDLGHDIQLPVSLARLDAGEFYDRDLNISPLTEKPPPRSPAEQAKARAKRLA
jgi:hypothetical protein